MTSSSKGPSNHSKKCSIRVVPWQCQSTMLFLKRREPKLKMDEEEGFTNMVRTSTTADHNKNLQIIEPNNVNLSSTTKNTAHGNNNAVIMQTTKNSSVTAASLIIEHEEEEEGMLLQDESDNMLKRSTTADHNNLQIIEPKNVH